MQLGYNVTITSHSLPQPLGVHSSASCPYTAVCVCVCVCMIVVNLGHRCSRHQTTSFPHTHSPAITDHFPKCAISAIPAWSLEVQLVGLSSLQRFVLHKHYPYTSALLFLLLLWLISLSSLLRHYVNLIFYVTICSVLTKPFDWEGNELEIYWAALKKK